MERSRINVKSHSFREPGEYKYKGEHRTLGSEAAEST